VLKNINTISKISSFIWNMLVKGQAYNPPTEYLFLDEKRKLKIINKLNKQITKFGLTADEVTFPTG